MFHDAATMWHKENQRYSHRLPLEPSEAALEHPSMLTLVESRDTNLLQVAEQIYKGEYVAAPSMFTSAQCNDLMKELQRALSECLTWACLQGKRGQLKCPLGAGCTPEVQKKKIKP